MRGYGSTPGATSREQAIITRLADAERRAVEPSVRAALDEGAELIRQLIAERARRVDLEAAGLSSEGDPVDWCPPCPDFEPDPPCPDF